MPRAVLPVKCRIEQYLYGHELIQIWLQTSSCPPTQEYQQESASRSQNLPTVDMLTIVIIVPITALFEHFNLMDCPTRWDGPKAILWTQSESEETLIADGKLLVFVSQRVLTTIRQNIFLLVYWQSVRLQVHRVFLIGVFCVSWIISQMKTRVKLGAINKSYHFETISLTRNA